LGKERDMNSKFCEMKQCLW